MAVLGAAGGIGQPLSLLLNLSGKFERLSLFDIVNTPGVAADIAHCNTATKVCDVVVVAAAAAAKALSASPTHCSCNPLVLDCYSHPQVEGFVGQDQLGDALKGADIVVIPAGVPRKPGMTRDDLFSTNASIVKGLAEACAA